MSTRPDDEEFDRFRRWLSERAADRAAERETREPKNIRWLVLYILGVCLIAAALLAVGGAEAAVKSVKVDPPKIVLKRGSYNIATFDSLQECDLALAALYEKDGVSKESGYGVYKCLYDQSTRVAFGPNPVTCTTPKPAQQSQVAQCPSPTVGTFSQTRDYTAAPYPTCWTLGEWTPAAAPAGICASPVAQLQVYTCADAGADGRILESDAVRWPNCQSVSYKTPSRSLVVAVNPGTRPFYWRLASKVTDDRLWTQTGGVGAWVRASAIDWGTPPTLGSVTISWTPPTKNTDDTPLTNLAGYRIVYGTAPTSLDKTIPVPATATSHIVQNLSPATWYFAVRSYNLEGTESVNSNVASKVIP